MKFIITSILVFLATISLYAQSDKEFSKNVNLVFFSSSRSWEIRECKAFLTYTPNTLGDPIFSLYFSKFLKISKICKFRGPDPPTLTFLKWPQNLIVCSVKRVIFSKNWKFEKNTKNTLVHTRETHTYFGDFHSSWTPKMSLGKIWDFSGSEFKKRGKISVFVP